MLENITGLPITTNTMFTLANFLSATNQPHDLAWQRFCQLTCCQRKIQLADLMSSNKSARQIHLCQMTDLVNSKLCTRRLCAISVNCWLTFIWVSRQSFFCCADLLEWFVNNKNFGQEIRQKKLQQSMPVCRWVHFVGWQISQCEQCINRVLTGRMPFTSPNQQCQSTELSILTTIFHVNLG